MRSRCRDGAPWCGTFAVGKFGRRQTPSQDGTGFRQWGVALRQNRRISLDGNFLRVILSNRLRNPNCVGRKTGTKYLADRLVQTRILPLISSRLVGLTGGLGMRKKPSWTIEVVGGAVLIAAPL